MNNKRNKQTQKMRDLTSGYETNQRFRDSQRCDQREVAERKTDK